MSYVSYFAESTGTQNLEKEVQLEKLFTSPSGVFNATIKFAGLYKTPDSQSTGLYISFELENGVTFDQYLNYITKEGKSTRINDKGREVKGHGLEQLESWDFVVGFGKPKTDKAVIYKMWGKDREAFLMPDAIGKTIKVCVRQVEETNIEGNTFTRNEAEMLAKMDGTTSGELYFEKDDKRHISLDKWKAKIEKTPILYRDLSKPKKKEEPKKAESSSDWVSDSSNPWG